MDFEALYYYGKRLYIFCYLLHLCIYVKILAFNESVPRLVNINILRIIANPDSDRLGLLQYKI